MSFLSPSQLLLYGEMITLGINATNLGVSVWSELKQDPNNPRLLAELRRLVNAAEFNNEVGHHFSEPSLVLSRKVRLIYRRHHELT